MNRFHITLSCTAVALVVAMGAPTPTLARVCGEITFSFNNNSDGPIRVTGVGYRDLNSGNPATRRVENVHNTACAARDTCQTDGDDLGSITRPRENHQLTDIQFRYQEQDDLGDWQDDAWGSTHVPGNLYCTDRRNYGPFDVK